MADSVDNTGDKLSLEDKKRMFRIWEDNKQTTGEIEEQRVSRKYYHGKQWTDTEVEELRRRKQPVLTSNRIKRKVDFLVGMEQRQRTDPKAFPRTPQHQEGAGLATQGVRFVCDNNKWPSLASTGAHNGLVTGIGGVTGIVEEIRGQKEIVLEELRPDEIFYDPRSVDWDFSDARYKGLHKWVDIATAKEMHPGMDIKSLEGSAGGYELDKITDDDKDKNWSDFEQSRIRLVEMYYKHNGVWRLTHFTGFEDLYDEPSFYLDEDGQPECPYRLWSSYVDEEGIRYGVVRDMKSPQDEVNQRRSKLLYFMSVRQTAGEAGAVDSVADMKNQTARPDGHVTYNPGKKFEFVDNTFQAQGQAELLQEAKAEIENLGPNPGLIGRGVEKQSGRAILAQQNSGMTELSPVFERLRGWKLSVYRMIWTRIQQTWTGPRWLRVTDDERSLEFTAINQPVQLEDGSITFQNTVGELDVDIILDEGPDTLTIQEEEFEGLANMVQSGLQIPPDIIIEASSLPNKEKLLERMRSGGEEKTPEQQQQEALEQELTIRRVVAEVMQSEAQVQKTQAETAKIAAQTQETAANTEQTEIETDLTLSLGV